MAWKRGPQGDFVINRFPICAAWYYSVARYLGYDDEQSKSLAIARATFFAAAKQGFKHAGGAGAKKGAKGGAAPFPAVPGAKEALDTDSVNFCGLAVTIEMESGLAVFGGEIQDPAKYDKGVLNKLVAKVGYNGYQHLIAEMDKLVRKHSKAEMNSNSAYKLYTDIRDEFRKKDFFNTVMQVA